MAWQNLNLKYILLKLIKCRGDTSLSVYDEVPDSNLFDYYHRGNAIE